MVRHLLQTTGVAHDNNGVAWPSLAGAQWSDVALDRTGPLLFEAVLRLMGCIEDLHLREATDAAAAAAARDDGAIDPVTVLPAEVMVAILGRLSERDLGRCAQLSKAWAGLASDGPLWRSHYERRYLLWLNAFFIIIVSGSGGVSWLERARGVAFQWSGTPPPPASFPHTLMPSFFRPDTGGARRGAA